MFYHVSMEQGIDLEPMFFGPKLKDTIRMKIVEKVIWPSLPSMGCLGKRRRVEFFMHEQVEGTCSAKYGYIIAVLAVDTISQVGSSSACREGIATELGHFLSLKSAQHPCFNSVGLQLIRTTLKHGKALQSARGA